MFCSAIHLFHMRFDSIDVLSTSKPDFAAEEKASSTAIFTEDHIC
jgi:hypothetical protein